MTKTKTLREWLREKQLRQEDFAKLLTEEIRKLGDERTTIKQYHVTRWLEKTTPSIEMLELIEDVTNGEVIWKSFAFARKYAGDKRLVDKKLAKPEILAKWRMPR